MMAKFYMVATSSAKDGRDDEYNAWYDNEHMRDICSLPGVISGMRLDAVPVSPHQQPATYLAIYEIEVEGDNPGPFLAALRQKSEAGEMSVTDALDPESGKLWMYKPH